MLDKTYDAASVEPRIYETWEKAEAFKAGAGAKEGAASFSIVIPPPNVNGSLHMGHALNNTLQDILIRWKRMQGFDTLWQPGTDHAGIALQIAVERQMAERNEPSRTEIGREAFVQRAWRYKGEVGSAIITQLKRLGASCDWSRERFTMDEGLSEAVRKVFVDLYNEGLIYKSKRLVNWDPKMETAISDLEVENIETDGHMWHFRYPLAGGATYEYVEKDEEGNITLRETRDYISIATTRPETMLGDGAVAVHPDDERYRPIVGKLCEIPVGPKEHRRLIPIITDEYPDPDFGSGAVKITGAHDFNDYGVAQRNKIPMYRLMDTKGAMRADGAPYVEEAAKAQAIIDGAEMTIQEVDLINIVPDDLRGLDRFEARKRVIEQITAEGLAVTAPADHPDVAWMKGQAPEWNTLGRAVVRPLEEGAEAPERLPLVESKKIMQPFGDRSKVVIEPMLTDQWFVDAKTLAAPALKAVQDGTTKLIPGNADKVYFNWLNDIQPWCISRQLWWGHQIPVWYDEDGKEYCAHSEEEAVAMAGGKALTRDEDVLDTWFSSALWPFSTLGWPHKTPELERYYKTDVLITGLDIIFFWVARMMMQGIHFMDEVPFHTVYFNSIVVDGKGKKMSKSTGNVIDPLDLIGRFGADATRFALASQEVQARRMLRMSDQAAEGGQRFATKLWNAARFAEMNGCARMEGFDPAATKHTLNRWIATETGRCIAEVTEALEDFRFNDASGAAYRFTWNTFCDWYLELAKPIFNGEDEAAKAETRATAAWALDEILKVLHPIMPFLTEELWERLGDEGNAHDGLLMLTAWPEAKVSDEAAAGEINWLVDLISEIRSVRAEMNIPAGAKVSVVVAGASDQTKARLKTHESAILRLARAEAVSLADAAPSGAAQIIVGEATVCLPLAGVIDLGAEKTRLQKEAGKLEGEISKIEKKLSNPAFVAKAPEEVVDGEREKVAESKEKLEKVQTALSRLAEIG
ncbi:Valine--tRNA ligase [Labrenzia sp. THAF191b]|uniref:valine--tRNA ligase n=1 Tax=unclassified Labrenzia TaxID=2648686 RepID=UPI0012679A39|nr:MULTISPECIES: valine--tRNA ligase [unclassified Labrenzia]QFT00012.1 Valine--tRNA ligase [Labrenzia sp. THAF191b]QFT06325.1 Valine--tRNA ligase [Labrenzia sp. THAF191a]QFT17869.1 Valine--tRNA ligase [Labrenzia sp. THAF187b]